MKVPIALVPIVLVEFDGDLKKEIIREDFA